MWFMCRVRTWFMCGVRRTGSARLTNATRCTELARFTRLATFSEAVRHSVEPMGETLQFMLQACELFVQIAILFVPG